MNLPEIKDLPHDTPFNKPLFQDLDISKMGKTRIGTPRPAAFTIGLCPIPTREGNITHLVLSGGGGIQPVENWSDVVEILCHEYGQHFIYVTHETWTLDCLLKFLPLQALQDLYTNGHLYYEGTQIWYTPGHKLTLLRDKKEARIQVLGNWFKRSGVKAACRKAGYSYVEGDVLGAADALKGLGNALLERIKIGDLSTPSIITRQLLNHDLRKTDSSRIPSEVLEISYSCLHAPWIEIMAQGYFPNVYDYDLNNAYPTEIAQLIICDERVGRWVQSAEYESGGRIRTETGGIEEVEYGFAQAVVTLRAGPGEVSPIRFRKATGNLFSPYGMWVAYLTKGEIDFIRKWQLGHVDILNGWWFIPTERIRPFLKTVEKLVETRNSKDPLTRSLTKSIAVRMNGHFLQKVEIPIFEGDIRTRRTKWVAGPLFNPVYACQVMTQTKLKLAEMSMEAVRRGGKVLAITVDGLVTNTRLGKRTGRKLETKSPAVIAAPLVMHLEDRESKLNLLRELWKDPGLGTYKLGDDKRIELKEALVLGRPELIGNLEKLPIRMRVGSDITRIWEDIPTRGEHLLTRAYFGKQPPIEYCMMGRRR